MSNSKELFHVRFEERLDREEWTEVSFGKKAGIASTLVGQYKRRQATPGLEILDKIAAVWGLTAAEFIAPEEPPASRIPKPSIKDSLKIAGDLLFALTALDESELVEATSPEPPIQRIKSRLSGAKRSPN